MAEFPEEAGNKTQEIHFPRKLLTAFKILFFIICLTGFSIQAAEFLKFYLTYPTVIEHRTGTPDKMMAPAITYCYVSSITRNKFCELLPDVCYKPQENETDCRNFPAYCQEDVEIPNWKESNIKSKIDFDDLKPSGPVIKKFLYGTPWDIPSEESVGPNYYAAWWSLNIFTCYTVHSRVNSSKEPREVELNFSTAKRDPSSRYLTAFMGFNLRDNKTMDPKTMLGVTIDIHSPFTTALPQMKNLLKVDTRYEIELKIVQEKLLPAPYETNCGDYKELWERNNRTGPRSKRVCDELCEIQKDELCFGCLDIWNAYPYSGKKCIIGVNQGTEGNCNATILKKYRNCISSCKRECSNTKYTFSVTEIKKDPWDYRGYYEGIIEINIFMDQDILILKHRPQYQDVELFSYLGGYIGIWLGVSLYALTDFLRSIFVIMTPRLWRFQKRFRASAKKRSQSEATKSLKT